MSQLLLKIENLSMEFRTRAGIVHALDRVNLTLSKGEILGLVGESGSGKSVTANAIMGLSDPAACVTGGRIVYSGVDLLGCKEATLGKMRGAEFAMVFQNPRAALNPIRKVGLQIEDVLLQHNLTSKAEAQQKSVDALTRVQIPDPHKRYYAYPFELSGGMCQRVLIAQALSCEPGLLIADEPVTGLDVTTQATIMDLIVNLARQAGMATLLITHDLALAAEYCDRIAVMHAGQVVEVASVQTLLHKPQHPYTAKLICATPTKMNSLDDLGVIPGNLPDLRGALPPCRFAARCDRYAAVCDAPDLSLMTVGQDHSVACRRPLS